MKNNMLEFIDLKTQYGKAKESIGERIQAVLDHGQYILGPEVRELEERLESYVGVTHCVSCGSGTDALLIALLALGVGVGDEVITTPFTFIATAEVIALIGAVPVFVDIDPKTFNVDPVQVGQAITPRTKAIVAVSLYGQCADFDAINEIAQRHGIPVIEDAAQSLGATYKGRQSCGLSTIGCASFFPSKPLGGYGDGGACFTRDDELATRMRQIRVHGQDKRYHHALLGINGRLDTIQAAVLLAKLDLFPDEVAARGRIGARYTELLQGHVNTPYLEPHNTSVYAQYTVRVQRRNEVQEKLKQEGIPTAVHYPIPLNLQPTFGYLNLPAGSFPFAEEISREVMSLPMHPYLGADQQDRIAARLIAVLTQ